MGLIWAQKLMTLNLHDGYSMLLNIVTVGYAMSSIGIFIVVVVESTAHVVQVHDSRMCTSMSHLVDLL